MTIKWNVYRRSVLTSLFDYILRKFWHKGKVCIMFSKFVSISWFPFCVRLRPLNLWGNRQLFISALYFSRAGFFPRIRSNLQQRRHLDSSTKIFSCNRCLFYNDGKLLINIHTVKFIRFPFQVKPIKKEVIILSLLNV